jgi:hypothetical protein
MWPGGTQASELPPPGADAATKSQPEEPPRRKIRGAGPETDGAPRKQDVPSVPAPKKPVIENLEKTGASDTKPVAKPEVPVPTELRMPTKVPGGRKQNPLTPLVTREGVKMVGRGDPSDKKWQRPVDWKPPVPTKGYSTAGERTMTDERASRYLVGYDFVADRPIRTGGWDLYPPREYGKAVKIEFAALWGNAPVVPDAPEVTLTCLDTWESWVLLPTPTTENVAGRYFAILPVDVGSIVAASAVYQGTTYWASSFVWEWNAHNWSTTLGITIRVPGEHPSRASYPVVLEDQRGNPLAGAAIQTASSTQIVAITDDRGRADVPFDLIGQIPTDPDGNAPLAAWLPGYAPVFFRLTGNGRVRIGWDFGADLRDNRLSPDGGQAQVTVKRPEGFPALVLGNSACNFLVEDGDGFTTSGAKAPGTADASFSFSWHVRPPMDLAERYRLTGISQRPHPCIHIRRFPGLDLSGDAGLLERIAPDKPSRSRSQALMDALEDKAYELTIMSEIELLMDGQNSDGEMRTWLSAPGTYVVQLGHELAGGSSARETAAGVLVFSVPKAAFESDEPCIVQSYFFELTLGFSYPAGATDLPKQAVPVAPVLPGEAKGKGGKR